MDATQLVTNSCMVPGVDAIAERRVRYSCAVPFEMIRTFKAVTTLIPNAVEKNYG